MQLLKKEFKTMKAKEIAKIITTEILESGYIDLKDIIELRKMHDAIGKALADKAVKSFIEDQHALQGAKTAELNGSKITRRDTPRYNYKDCGHTTYNSLCENIAKMTELKKICESEMKNIEDSKNIFMESTYQIQEIPCGELAEVSAPTKLVVTSFAFTV